MGAKLRDKELTARVAKNLVKLLAREGKTSYRLAKDIGVSQGAIADFRHERSLPSLSTAMKIVSSLGCTLEDLVK